MNNNDGGIDWSKEMKGWNVLKISVIIYFKFSLDNSNMKCMVRVIYYKILFILLYLINL